MPSKDDPKYSSSDIREAKAEATQEARKDMVIEQLVEDQQKTAKHLTTITSTLASINTDLAEGRGVMEVIQSQAEQSIEIGNATMKAAQGNTQALMDHMNNHPQNMTTALTKKPDPLWKPIVIQVAGTLLTAALLGGLYASFAMSTKAAPSTAPTTTTP